MSKVDQSLLRIHEVPPLQYPKSPIIRLGELHSEIKNFNTRGCAPLSLCASVRPYIHLQLEKMLITPESHCKF